MLGDNSQTRYFSILAGRRSDFPESGFWGNFCDAFLLDWLKRVVIWYRYVGVVFLSCPCQLILSVQYVSLGRHDVSHCLSGLLQRSIQPKHFLLWLMLLIWISYLNNTRVKSCNFGHQVNSVSDIIFIL